MTLDDLGAALADGRIERLLGSPLVQTLAAAAHVAELESRPLTLGRATEILEGFQSLLQQTVPLLTDVVVCGDARRFEPVVWSVVVVARASDPATAIDAVATAPWVEAIAFRSSRRLLLLWQNTELDLRVAAPDEYGTTVFLATGSPQHLRAVRARRGVQGLAPREEDVYSQAGLAWIPPELRHGSGEVEAAARKALPPLVELDHIRGDLHIHTTYSDGQDSPEAVVAACVALGYDYMAITDHSEHSAASRTITPALILRQRDEIARLQDQHPEITILQGLEVDILPSGRLDCPDKVLEGLDIVLASLHDPDDHDGSQLTRRCLGAIRHPLVNVITHPSNQLVGRRPGYDLNYSEVYAAAVETGTALEIDGAPSHLDLDGEHAREAIAAGVTLTIDSDGHRARALGRQMRFGIGTARRGWVEPRHVLNTRSLGAVRAFVQAKRNA